MAHVSSFQSRAVYVVYNIYGQQSMQQAIVGIFDFLLFIVAIAMEDLLRTPLYHTPRTNQMGYIKVKAQLPGIYGNVNRPCPQVAPSDSGRFTAINPWQLGLTIT